MTITIQLLVCVVGLIIYALAKTQKPETLGLHMFWCGLLAFLLNVSGIIHIFNTKY